VKINADEIETSVPKRQEVVEQDENSEGTMTYFDESKAMVSSLIPIRTKIYFRTSAGILTSLKKMIVSIIRR
jgi:hypothetical protein